jgi:hypothetical protein
MVKFLFLMIAGQKAPGDGVSWRQASDMGIASGIYPRLGATVIFNGTIMTDSWSAASYLDIVLLTTFV